MLIELIRALLCMTCLAMGVLAIWRSGWDIFRILTGMFIVAVMTPEVLEAVNFASTHMHDVGGVRKVGWPTIVAAILTLWFGRNWLVRSHSEPTQ